MTHWFYGVGSKGRGADRFMVMDMTLIERNPGIETRVEFANMLRGVAVCCVVLYHFALFWIFPEARKVWANLDPAGSIPDLTLSFLHEWRLPPGLASGLPFLGSLSFDLGAFGVALFFLVSGFVIPLSLNRYSRISFSIGRVFRIYPTYIAGYTIVILAFAASSVFSGLAFLFRAYEVALSSLPPLNDLVSTVFINPPVWSLVVELKFYVICAAIAPLLRERRVLAFAVPVALAGLACLVRHQVDDWHSSRLANDALFCIYIFVGVALSYFWCGYLSRAGAALLCTTLLSIFLILWPFATDGQAYSRASSYIAAVVVFVACMKLPLFVTRARLARFFADVSYPLYIVHLAPGFLAMAVASRFVSIWAAVAFGFLCVVGLSAVLHVCIERPTHKLGQYLAVRANTKMRQRRSLPAGERGPRQRRSAYRVSKESL